MATSTIKSERVMMNGTVKEVFAGVAGNATVSISNLSHGDRVYMYRNGAFDCIIHNSGLVVIGSSTGVSDVNLVNGTLTFKRTNQYTSDVFVQYIDNANREVPVITQS
jgi:hypothetical protein